MNIYYFYFFAYFLGSIPFGLIFSKIFNIGDIRKIGSGNIGATNVLRSGNKFVALLTLLCDLAKGYIAVKLVNNGLDYNYSIMAGYIAIIGHIFPIWLKFKGGKGVATALGVLLALHYSIALIFIASWLIIFIISRYSSLSAIIAFFIVDLFVAFILVHEYHTYLSQFMMLLLLTILFTHKQNIKRLFIGEEPKSKFKRT